MCIKVRIKFSLQQGGMKIKFDLKSIGKISNFVIEEEFFLTNI